MCFYPAFVSQAAAWLLVLMTASDVMVVTTAYRLEVKLFLSLQRRSAYEEKIETKTFLLLYA